MQPRIGKSIARLLTLRFAPECGEVFKTLRAKRGGWIKMPDEIEMARKNSGLGDTYVLLYEAEPRIYFCLYKAIFPKDTVKYLEQFDAGLAAISEAEKIKMLKDFDNDLSDETIYAEIEDTFSQMKMTPEAAKAQFEALPEEERIESIQRVQLALA